jgi:diguanylate cyclase (GGDEF)-like protein
MLAASTAVSIILTNIFMEVFSNGLNVAGLAVAVVMPLVLGGPMMFYLTLRHEQLRHANKQLELLASTDWLTTCLNRGAFTTRVVADLERRATGPVSDGAALLIIDADDFKQVNDRFGHQQGDSALQMIADAIRASVRSSDLVGRMGGEEFGVYLTGADPGTADQVAERIRHAVSCLRFAPLGAVHQLSVSIGGATFAHRADFNVLYRLADQRLYQAKSQGRDRVDMMQAA